MEMTNNGSSRNGLGEGTKMCENDPLQMLAKQCDTISGDEEGGGTKGAKGSKSMAKGGEGGKSQTMMAQKVGNQTKAKSPNKHLFDQQQCLLPSQAIFPNGAFLPPNPAQLAALMNNPFLGPISQQRHPQPHPMGPPPQFPPNGSVPPPQFGPPPPPSAQLNLMQQLMAAVQQQMPSPHLLPPGMFPPPHPGHSGIPLPPSMPMPFRKPDQPPNIAPSQAEVEAAALAMAMFQGAPAPNNPFPQGNVPSASAPENGASVQQLLQQPLQNILMAIACGQLPQIPCLYKIPGGSLCGRIFPSADQLLAHLKSAHIAQMSSPSAVSSTTEGSATVSSTICGATQTTQTPTTTATGGGGKMRQNKNSPNSSRSTPTNTNGAQMNSGQKPNSNPGPMMFNGGGWPPPHLVGIPPPPPQAFIGGGGNGQHRFHPYLMPQQNGQNSSNKEAPIQPPPTQNQIQQMALAWMANGGLSLGAPHLDLGVPHPAHPQPPSQALNALTAMANSIDSNANQPNGQSTKSSASVGAGSG